MRRTVLVNAGPWLPVPPDGYGGIENVLATLVPELRLRGIRVVLSTIGASTLEVDERCHRFEGGQFEHLAGPYNAVMGVGHAHMGTVLERVRAGGIDLIHDHLEVVGPSVLSALDGGAPPVLQTLHWNLRKHPDFYANFHGRERVFFNGVSASQLRLAPANLRAQVLGYIHLGVPVERLPFQADKGEELLLLGRCTWDKGSDLAARLAKELGIPLTMAGPVGGLPTPERLFRELQDERSPFRDYADVRYYLDDVRVFEDGERIRWIGTAGEPHKQRLLGHAKALLLPLRWDEPGGTVALEALACGTPVVGMRRGVLPEIIEHGVTGFLADDEDEFATYLPRVGELDPHDCRRAAEERFSAATMATKYVRMYEEVLERAG